ncbi:hypothetical protein GPJ56_007220 [Histomonas meleagridis]|nr:hypothetical protein GPJ56_007220 [Histomonas meleagridis]
MGATAPECTHLSLRAHACLSHARLSLHLPGTSTCHHLGLHATWACHLHTSSTAACGSSCHPGPPPAPRVSHPPTWVLLLVSPPGPPPPEPPPPESTPLSPRHCVLHTAWASTLHLACTPPGPPHLACLSLHCHLGLLACVHRLPGIILHLGRTWVPPALGRCHLSPLPHAWLTCLGLHHRLSLTTWCSTCPGLHHSGAHHCLVMHCAWFIACAGYARAGYTLTPHLGARALERRTALGATRADAAPLERHAPQRRACHRAWTPRALGVAPPGLTAWPRTWACHHAHVLTLPATSTCHTQCHCHLGAPPAWVPPLPACLPASGDPPA